MAKSELKPWALAGIIVGSFILIPSILLAVLMLKTQYLELRKVVSASMEPALHPGDYLYIDKAGAGLKPWRRGDIVIFYPPHPNSVVKTDALSTIIRKTGLSHLIYRTGTARDKVYISRVIGLPGETIHVVPRQGVFINGKALEEPYITEPGTVCTQYHRCEALRLPKNAYFLMGDNRNHSLDSRYFGLVPGDRIYGRVVKLIERRRPS